MKAEKQFSLETANRGICDYVISQDAKGYYAHELGDKTQWAQVMDNDERKAHRINPNKRIGNRYRTQWVPMAYKSIQQAESAAKEYASRSITHH